MARLISLAVIVVTLPNCDATTSVSGYTPTTDVGTHLALGQTLEAFSSALSSDPRDWTAALAAYNKEHSDGASLRSVLPTSGGDRLLLSSFVSYYESEDYMHSFVSQALQATGKFENLDEKMREELTMKGVVLQGFLMAAMTSLHDATSACAAGQPATEVAKLLDSAWSLYACSETKGPIRLAEKRAPQFKVESAHQTEAGGSEVNRKLLAYFLELQESAQSLNCAQMQTIVPKVIAQMQVPVIQGMLREAYEVDPKKIEETRGADGFVEVAEGWAFARAVLPAIHTCSADAAETIRRNMDTLELGAEGAHLPDGFEVVKTAVESVYPCLGISCTDVNAMGSFTKTDELLWEPCKDADLSTSTTIAVTDLGTEADASASTPLGVGVALMLAFVVALRR